MPASVVARSKQNMSHLSRRAGLQCTVEDRRQVLNAWLAERETEGGVTVISPARPFGDSEEEYEEAIGSHNAASAGGTVHQLWPSIQGGTGGLALELGAGSGAVTTGFVESADGFTTLVTDPSLEFLAMTRRKLSRLADVPEDAVRYATLWEKISRFSPRTSLTSCSSRPVCTTLPIGRSFCGTSGNILTPGGVLLFQEPFSEGTFFMGIAAETLMRADGVPDDDRERLERMRQSIYLSPIARSTRTMARTSTASIPTT